MGEDGPVKIGLTGEHQVARRLAGLQSANPYKLRLLGTRPGAWLDERQLHQRFSEHRLEGEWFEPVPELLRFIEGRA